MSYTPLFCMILLCFSQANHIIFEQVGEMASSVTYLHVKMDVNLQIIQLQAEQYLKLIHRIQLHSEKEKETALSKIKVRFDNVRSLTFIEEERVLVNHLNNINHICETRRRKAKTMLADTKSLRHTLPNPSTPTHVWKTEREPIDMDRKKRDLSERMQRLSSNLTKTALRSASNMVTSKMANSFKELLKGTVKDTLIRQPRGLVALGLGALGTFMGLFNTYQINNLEKELQQTKEAHNRLVEVVHDNSVNLRRLDEQVELLTASIDFIQRNDLTVLLMGFMNIEHEIIAQLNKATHVTQVAQNHRLAVDFLPAEQLPTLFEKLKGQATAIDHKLVIKQPSDLFQLELSYFYDGISLQMLLHVPAVPKESVLRLLKLHPFPLPLNKNYSIIPMVHDDLLAISAGFNRYSAQLSSVDLLGCHAINNIYLCERHGVLGKQLNNSCLGALYLQDFILAQELCPLHIRPAGEVVRQLLDNWFLIFSPDPQTAYVSCRNGTENEAYIKSGITRSFLSPGCKMNLKYHLLQSDFSLSLPDDIVNFQWDWDTTPFVTELEGDMQYLYENGNADPTLHDLIEVKKRSPAVMLFRIFVTFIISVVALSLVALVIFWYLGRDYILRLPFFKRFNTPAVHNLIDASHEVIPKRVRTDPATAPLYPHLDRELPRVPAQQIYM